MNFQAMTRPDLKILEDWCHEGVSFFRCRDLMQGVFTVTYTVPYPYLSVFTNAGTDSQHHINELMQQEVPQ